MILALIVRPFLAIGGRTHADDGAVTATPTTRRPAVCSNGSWRLA